MRLTTSLAIVVTILVLAAPATAQPQPPPPAVPPDIGAILDYREALGLSDAQMEALDRLGLDLSREVIRRQADAAIAELDLDALLDVDPSKAVDVAAAEAKVREIERTRADLQLAVIRTMERAKALLTAEQRAKLATLLDGRRPPASRAGTRPAPFGPPPALGQAPPPPAYGYYCASARAYFPSVASCPETWIPVPPPGR